MFFIPGQSLICCRNCHFFQLKCKDTQDAIQSAGHELEYLPPYSPDLNPIEHKWAQAKKLRKAKFCEVDELFSASTL
jgi:transposase